MFSTFDLVTEDSSSNGNGAQADVHPGADLKARRVRLGLTQKRLAEEAGVRPEQLSRVESGRTVGDLSLSKVRAVLEQYERRYGVDNPDQIVSVIELPDGTKVTFTGTTDGIADVVNKLRDRG